MKTAYSYLRISSEKQTQGGGIERQMQASRAYAEQHGYTLVETLQDIGVSAYKGKNSSEGALGAFIDAINSGSVAAGSVLIVESLDRLSRQDPMAAFTQFSQIISKGVTIVTLVDGQTYSPDSVKEDVSKLFISLGSMMRAHDESKVKSSRQLAAWNRKRKDGAVMTTRCPAWLEVVDGEFKVKEGAQKIIDYIFDSSLSGMGAYGICRHMNRNISEYPSFTGGKTWNKNYILKILSSGHVIGELQTFTSVTGKREPAGDPIKGYFPAVVTEEKFRAVQAGLAQRQKSGAGRKGKNYTNIFSNILKCGRCGGAWTYRPQTTGRGHDMIRCSFAHQGKDCDAPGWRYSDFERDFIKFVKELDFCEVFGGAGASKKIVEMQSKAMAEQDNLTKMQQQIDVIFDRMTSLELSETMIAGLATKEKALQDSLKEAKERKENFEHEAMRLSSIESVKIKEEFEQLYSKISKGDHELRANVAGMLKRVIRRIDLYSHKKMKWEDHRPERYTIVTFINGEQRIIFEGGSVKTIDADDLDLVKQFKSK